MFTDELTEAMTAEVDDLVFGVDIEAVLSAERKMRRRRNGASVVVGVVGVLAVVSVVVLNPGGLAGRARVTPVIPAQRHLGTLQPVPGPVALAAFSMWGPTRGNLAGDEAFRTLVRHEWANPTGPESYKDKGPRDMTGPIRILYAGQTPDGPAAVVAQQSTRKQEGILVGVMTTIPGSGLSLWGPNSNGNWGDSTIANVGRFDAHQVSFSSGSGRHIIVLPTNPSDQVSVSVGHRLSSNGYAVRTWTPLSTVDGVATVSAPSASSSWDTLVRTSHDGRVQDESSVWINAGPLPSPSNALDNSMPDLLSVAGGALVGFDADLYTSWVQRHGASFEPYGDSGWQIGGALPNGDGLNVQQMWLYGDPAHTVVSEEVNNKWHVLYDRVTDPHAKPLLAVRLPAIGGWLVVAGPHSIVTGYRAVGATQWKIPPRGVAGTDESGTPSFSRAAALIKTSSPNIQLRLIVDGVPRIFTEPS
jgi:hypothetical protein